MRLLILLPALSSFHLQSPVAWAHLTPSHRSSAPLSSPVLQTFPFWNGIHFVFLLLVSAGRLYYCSHFIAPSCVYEHYHVTFQFLPLEAQYTLPCPLSLGSALWLADVMEAESWVVLKQLGFAHVHLWHGQENNPRWVAPGPRAFTAPCNTPGHNLNLGTKLSCT